MDQLSQWITEPGNEELFEDIVTAHYHITAAMHQPDIERIKENLIRKIKQEQRVLYRRRFFRFTRYAAMGILLIGLPYFYYQSRQLENDTNTLTQHEEDITIVLDDGTVETLDLSANTSMYDALGNAIGTQEKSKLTYHLSAPTEKPLYNTINVPYGKTFTIVLSDSTQVFLNSGTMLRYPVHFPEGHPRTVVLKGEAYFEVSEDQHHPFEVIADELTVRVLGTKFNVAYYPEDLNITTVLVEGAVELREQGAANTNNTPVQLKPGFKAEWNQTSKKINVEDVNPYLYTAWTQGKIVFRNTPFIKIRQRLERHYNVTIRNNNKALDKQLFDATFDIESIEEVLESFNKSYAIQYEIKNNEIVIH
ncbi:MAG: DUF4974 domain-containing protein [Cyclobacteriaceae bacterium]